MSIHEYLPPACFQRRVKAMIMYGFVQVRNVKDWFGVSDGDTYTAR